MGEYFVEYDEDSQCWGIFHTDSGPRCYSLYASKLEAEAMAREMNEQEKNS